MGLTINNEQRALCDEQIKNGGKLDTRFLLGIGVNALEPYQELTAITEGYSTHLVRDPRAVKRNALISKASRFSQLAEYLTSSEAIELTVNHPRQFETKATSLARFIGKELSAEIRKAAVEQLKAAVEELIDRLEAMETEELELIGTVIREVDGKFFFVGDKDAQ